MSRETVHVEVYLKNNKITYLAYEIEDNDEYILFTPTLLKECLADFPLEDRVFLVPVELLKEKLLEFKEKINTLPPRDNLVYKINCLIGFIQKNSSTYYGLRTVCNL